MGKVAEEAEEFKIDKREWERVIQVTKKKLIKVFLAGATVASLVWALILYAYIQTGFII